MKKLIFLILLIPSIACANILHHKAPTAIQKRQQEEQAAANNPFSIGLFNPNYILPFYYTKSPYQAIYSGNTPDNQKVMRQELKAQFSIDIPLWQHILGTKNRLDIGYTQLMYWQVYAKSQYFRETNYMPEIFVTHPLSGKWQVQTGLVHQSNGRGGTYERSWNRAYINFIYSQRHWFISIKPWALVFQKQSSDC